MRKITEDIVYSFLNRRPKNIGNSSTDGEALYLHGNKIAYHGKQNGMTGVYISLADWNTNTTKERLRGLLSILSERCFNPAQLAPVVSIFTLDFQTYVGRVDRFYKNAIPISGKEWLFVAAMPSGLNVRRVEGGTA